MHGTVDSWDFATTLNSPTSTVRRTMLELSAAEDEGRNEDAVFVLEGDQSTSNRRSKAISWAEQEVTEIEANEAPSSPSVSSPSDQSSLTQWAVGRPAKCPLR